MSIRSKINTEFSAERGAAANDRSEPGLLSSVPVWNASESHAQQILPSVTSATRAGRDEMNLAEFPLTVLSTRGASQLKTLEFSDTIRDRNGQIVTRQWIITGADKFGLPTSSDDEVLLGLIKLTVHDAFRDRKVYFTRYELLRILRWSTEGRSYQRLQRALDRLSGVRIKASNAFFDNESKAHSTRNFGIIDAYEINDGRDSAIKPSFFIWSEVIFKSFQVGFIKKLDFEFYLALQSAVSKRLYRYLDKHFWYRSRVRINLFLLAHEKVGVSRNYRHASSLRQQLDPAFAELIKSGFLSAVSYEGKGSVTEVLIDASRGARKTNGSGTLASENGQTALSAEECAQTSNEASQARIRQTRVPERSEMSALNSAHTVEALLVARGIKEMQARRLVERLNDATLDRVRQIVEYFDQLISQGSRLVSKSPVGFLYRAVEHPEQFILPGEKNRVPAQTSLFSASRERQPTQKVVGSAVRGNTRPGDPVRLAEQRRIEHCRAGSTTATGTTRSLESDYLVERRLALRSYREDVEAELLKKIQSEVEVALRKLQGLISPDRFLEVIEHGVDEKLAKLFCFPSFDEWTVKQRKPRAQPSARSPRQGS